MSMQPQYTKARERLEHDNAIDSIPTGILNPNDIYLEIAMERQRQDAKWGEQNWPIRNEEAALTRYYKDAAQLSKDLCDKMASLGTLTWRDILKEEFDEVFAEEDATAQRAELVQVAAVAVAMIECIDRKTRTNTSLFAKEP